MKSIFFLTLTGLFLMGCIDSKKDSITFDNSHIKYPKTEDILEVFNYPTKTFWGSLTLKSIKHDLKVIEATSKAELGFVKKTYYLNQNKIYKIEQQEHIAEWAKYQDNYPSDKYEWNPEKMTYSDTTIIMEANNESDKEIYEKLEKEGLEIIEFIKKEKVISGNERGKLQDSNSANSE